MATTYSWRDTAVNPTLGQGKPQTPKTDLGQDAFQSTVDKQQQESPFGQAQKSGQEAFSPQKSGIFGALDNTAKTPSVNKLFGVSPTLKTQAEQTASQLLQGNTQPSLGSQLSRSEFDKQAQEAQRKQDESSALSGRAMTGQMAGDQMRFSNQLLGQRQDMEAKLQAQDEQQSLAKQQAGFGMFSDMQSKALEKEKLDTSVTMSNLDRELNKYNIDTNAGLKKEDLAQALAINKSELEFKTWATKAGLDDATANRLWQASENDKNRALTVSEGVANRAISNYQFDKKYGLDERQLQASIDQFGSKMDFDKYVADKQFSQEDKKLLWQEIQNKLDRDHQSGMQLTAQQHELLVEGMRENFNEKMAYVNNQLGLDTLEKQQQFQERMTNIQQTFERENMNLGFSQQEKMAFVTNEYAKELQAKGFDHDTAMQMAQQVADAQRQKAQIESTEKLQDAQIVANSENLQKQLGLSYAQLNQSAYEFSQQQEINLQRLGLDKEQIEMVKADKAFQNLASTVAVLQNTPGYETSTELQTQVNSMLTQIMVKSGAITPEEGKRGLLSVKASEYPLGAKDPKFIADAKAGGATDKDIADIQATAPKKDYGDYTIKEMVDIMRGQGAKDEDIAKFLSDNDHSSGADWAKIADPEIRKMLGDNVIDEWLKDLGDKANQKMADPRKYVDRDPSFDFDEAGNPIINNVSPADLKDEFKSSTPNTLTIGDLGKLNKDWWARNTKGPDRINALVDAGMLTNVDEHNKTISLNNLNGQGKFNEWATLPIDKGGLGVKASDILDSNMMRNKISSFNPADPESVENLKTVYSLLETGDPKKYTYIKPVFDKLAKDPKSLTSDDIAFIKKSVPGVLESVYGGNEPLDTVLSTPRPIIWKNEPKLVIGYYTHKGDTNVRNSFVYLKDPITGAITRERTRVEY